MQLTIIVHLWKSGVCTWQLKACVGFLRVLSPMVTANSLFCNIMSWKLCLINIYPKFLLFLIRVGRDRPFKSQCFFNLFHWITGCNEMNCTSHHDTLNLHQSACVIIMAAHFVACLHQICMYQTVSNHSTYRIGWNCIMICVWDNVLCLPRSGRLQYRNPLNANISSNHARSRSSRFRCLIIWKFCSGHGIDCHDFHTET